MRVPYRNLVVGLDLSGIASGKRGTPPAGAGNAALEAARRFAGKGTRVHLLTALDLDPLASLLLRGKKASSGLVGPARERLTKLAADLSDTGCRTSTAVATGRPADELLEDVRRHRRDLVVVGTRERGALARNVLGSTALRLLRRSPAAVWVARPGAWRAPPVVLAAIDLGDMAPRIVAAAGAVAAAAGGTLHVLHVVDFSAEDVLRTGAADAKFILEYRRQRRANAETAVPALVARALGKSGAAEIHLVDGDVNPTIVGFAERLGADLVVAGSVVRSALGAAFGLGRTAEVVLPAVHASLLVLKP